MAISDYWGLGNQDCVVFKKLSKPVTVCSDNLLQPLQLCSLAKAIGFQSSRGEYLQMKYSPPSLCLTFSPPRQRRQGRGNSVCLFSSDTWHCHSQPSSSLALCNGSVRCFSVRGWWRDLKVYFYTTPEAFLSKRQRWCCHPIWKSSQSPARPTEKQRLRLRLTSRCLTDHLAAAPNGDRSTEFL